MLVKGDLNYLTVHFPSLSPTLPLAYALLNSPSSPHSVQEWSIDTITAYIDDTLKCHT
jgi:hypothetical protein